MFGINGKFLVEFTLADKKDFIEQDNLLDFTITEEAGNIMPLFSITFIVENDSIYQYINEGNELKVSLGRTITELERYSLVFINYNHVKSGNKTIINATGCLNKLKYFDTQAFITDKISGVEALKIVGNRNFIVDNKIDPVTDVMNHIQYGISDKSFVNNIWLSTLIEDSCPLVGITTDGRMILRDLKKIIQDKTWDLYDNSNPDKYIQMSPDYKIESKKGFFNNLTGVGRQKFLYDLDDSSGIIQSEDVKSLIALTKKISVNADRQKKNFENGFINENVHKNFWRAYLRNISTLSAYSSVKLLFNFDDQFRKIHIYDTVYHREFNTDKKNFHEAFSGNYVITKVVKRLQQRSYITMCEASKENINQPKGNLR